jgi:hypothetical protein
MAEAVRLLGVKETLYELKTVEPEIYAQLVDDIKSIVQPAILAIDRAIPRFAPLSGMEHSGRSSYGPVKITPRVTPSATSYRMGQTAKLVQIEVMSTGKRFGLEMVDMAGRGSGRGRRPKPVTRPYEYKNGIRQHKLNGQGRAMIANLPGGGTGSRYVYPAVEAVFPVVQLGVLRSLDVAASKINRKLDRI